MGKTNIKQLKACICKRSRKTIYLANVYLGLIVIVTLMTASVIFVDLYATFIILAIVLISITISFIVNLFRCHSILCSMRKSALEVVAFINADFLFGGV